MWGVGSPAAEIARLVRCAMAAYGLSAGRVGLTDRRPRIRHSPDRKQILLQGVVHSSLQMY